MTLREIQRRLALFAGALGGAALVAACSSGTPNASGPVQVGFVYNDDSATVILLRWQSNGPGPMAGTIEIDSLPGSTLVLKPTHTTRKFTGTIDAKGNVTFSFPNWGTVHGTESKTGLELILPKDGGGQEAALFSVGTQSSYNDALTQLKESISVQNEQNSAAATYDPTAQPGAALFSAVAELEGDQQSHITSVTDVSGVGPAADKALAQARKFAGMADTQLQEGLSAHCLAMLDLDQEVLDVDDESTTVGFAASNMNGATTKIHNDVAAVNVELAKTLAADPHYDGGPGVPTPAQARQSVAGAIPALNSELATMNSAVDKVNGDMTSVYAIANAAAKVNGCGAPDPEPALIRRVN